MDSLTEIVAQFQSDDTDLTTAITSALGTHTSELNIETLRAQAAEKVNADAIAAAATAAANGPQLVIKRMLEIVANTLGVSYTTMESAATADVVGNTGFSVVQIDSTLIVADLS